MVILREGHVDVELLAEPMSGDLFLKARDERVGAELEVIILVLAAFEGDAVFVSVVIERHMVARLRGPVLHVDKPGVARAELGQLVLDLFVGNSLDGFLDFDALIITNLDVRLHGHGRGERISVGAAVQQFDVGAVNRLHARLLYGVLISGRIGFLNGVLIEMLSGIIFFNQSAGRLSFAESRNGQPLRVALIRGFYRAAELLGVYRDGELAFVGSGFFKMCQFHSVSSRSLRFSVT